MAQVYKKLVIDVNKSNPGIIAEAVQNDAQSRFLDVVLLDGSTPINLTGHEVRIYGKKFDKTEFYNNGEITEAANGRCQFEMTSQSLAAAGDLEVQIVIFKDNVEVLSTQKFTIKVVKSLMSDSAIESSNEYGALVVLYQNLYEAYDLMVEMVQKIGAPGEQAESLNLDTMFEVWDWMVGYLQENSAAGIVETVNTTLRRTGTHDSASDETVMGKLNKVSKSALTFLTPSDNLKITLVGEPVLVSTGANSSYRRQKISEPFFVPFDGAIKIVATLTLTKKVAATGTDFRVITPPNFRVEDGQGSHPSIFPQFMFESPVGTVGSFSGTGTPDRILIGTAPATSILSETNTMTTILKVNKGDVIAPLAYFGSGQANVEAATVDSVKIYYDEVVG